jgi:hypothetical protein
VKSAKGPQSCVVGNLTRANFLVSTGAALQINQTAGMIAADLLGIKDIKM